MFYEKMNIQESQLRKANIELTAREEEKRFLNMEVYSGGGWSCQSVS